MSEQFQCCFCGKTIAPFAADVGGLLYTTNIDGPHESQHDQQLYCHAACLKRHVHRTVHLYVLDLIEE